MSELIEDALGSSIKEMNDNQDKSSSNKLASDSIGEHQLTHLHIESNPFHQPIARIPNNDLGHGIIINGVYKGEPLEMVASAWIRYENINWVLSGWLYASHYSDVSHAVAFFKLHIRANGTGYVHILDCSNPVHTIEMITESGFHREEEFCWDIDPEVQRTALWEFKWK